MNLRIFAESLTRNEVNELSDILYAIKRRWMEANRIQLEVREAKITVDTYRDRAR